MISVSGAVCGLKLTVACAIWLDWNFLKKSACVRLPTCVAMWSCKSINAAMLPMMAIHATHVVGGSLKPPVGFLGPRRCLCYFDLRRTYFYFGMTN